MVSPVIDLSHHNPTPDWPAIKAAGVLGVIHKATEGAGYADPDRRSRLAGAYRAGLLIATYHFLRPGDMAAQMDHYLETIDAAKGERVVLDHEDADVPLSSLLDAIDAIWNKRPDLQITIYSGNLIKQQLGNNHNPTLAKTSLWIAHYTSNPSPTWPRGTWANWSLWQWTDKEIIPGISAPVDGDRWNGTADSLKRFLSPA
jgi:lysozyme